MDWVKIEKDPDFCEIKLERQDNMSKTNCGELESQIGHHFDKEKKMCNCLIQRGAVWYSVERAMK